MSTVALSRFLALAIASASLVAAQDATTSSITPLASKHFDYNNLPYQADTDNGIRGTQSGYNRCNSTTEGASSLCQTGYVNFADDWCLWSAPNPGATIGETEHEEVAWCTKPGRGTRLIPAGAITGLQFIKTKSYLQITGFIDQTKINLTPDDFGGELDPHGADFRGNPLGGLMYSNNLPSKSGDNNTMTQVIEWHNFMGANSFCMKVCDPADPEAPQLCQHIYDRIGVIYNCPNQAKNGTFESCEGENQDPPGIFTSNGQVMTYTQPPESLGPISTQPYEVRMPASSNCVTYNSADLFAALGTPTAVASSGSAKATASGSGTAKATGSASRSGSSAAATATGGSQSNGAFTVQVSAAATIFGTLFAAAFLS